MSREITVTGSQIGTTASGGGMAPHTLAVRHRVDSVQPRVGYQESSTLQILTELDLKATASAGQPFAEEYVYLSLWRRTNDPAGGPPPPQLTDAPGWINAHTGRLAVLRVRKDDVSLPQSTFDKFLPASQRPAGAAWLARIEDGDYRLPWIISPDDPEDAHPCVLVEVAKSRIAPPQGHSSDCFDMQTLTSQVLTSFAVQTELALADTKLPVDGATIAASNHRLYVIPHVPFEGSSGSIPGFGLVYAVRVIVRFLGGAVSTVDAYVPTSFHLYSDHRIVIDPLSALSSVPLVNPSRITVEHDLLIGPQIAAQLRDSFVQGLSDVPAPDGLITQEHQLQAAMYAAMGMEKVPASFPSLPGDYDVIALPEQRTTPDRSISTEVVQLKHIAVVRRSPTGASPGATLVPGGVRLIIGPTKARWEETVITIGPIETLSPFELFILV